MEKLGIYIHIPFCKKKCKYCDFISFSCDGAKQKEYVECLLKEIELKEYDSLNEITTIYIGGGTPSIIDSKDIIRILDKVKNKFNVKSNAEITIEVNPGTVSKEKLEDYKASGINRISMGLQSADNRLLELVGRIHTYEEFEKNYNLAKEVGFSNINVDLMLALPTQTEDDLVDSLLKVIKLNPKHISLYSLILEEGTELEKLIESGKYKLCDEELERKMYHKTKKILEKNGYKHYEISNFAKSGFESKHNLDCWNQEEYIGFGLAAHSYYKNKRFSNTVNLDEYIQNVNNEKIDNIIEVHEEQTRESKAKEFMMIGLRKINGVSISEFEKRFRVHPLFYFRFEISKLTDEGLLEVDLDNIRLTKKRSRPCKSSV